MILDPDRVVYDASEVEEIVANWKKLWQETVKSLAVTVEDRDAALAKVEELTCELTAYQVGDSDRSLAGEAEWGQVVALRGVEADDLWVERLPGIGWTVVSTEHRGHGDSLSAAFEAHTIACKP